MTNEEMLKDLWKDVHGNGREGLATRMVRVEEKMDSQMRNDADFKKYISKWFWIIVALALLAGGSPFAERFLEKYFGVLSQTSAQDAP